LDKHVRAFRRPPVNIILTTGEHAVGVDPQTANVWVREDRMPVPFRRLLSGTILVDVVEAIGHQRLVLYARVSSHDQRADLDPHVSRLTGWATGSGFAVGRVACSGLGASVRRWPGCLSDPSARVIVVEVVEHRDRLADSGVEHLHAALAAQGRRIVVVDAGGIADDVVRDMIEILTSMCAPHMTKRHPVSAQVAG
jgi:putative resolvase